MKTKEKLYTLPKVFAKKWVTALRSGGYKQTRETLYNKKGDGFCCLGVACLVAGKKREDLSGGAIASPYVKGSLARIPTTLHGGSSLASQLVDRNDSSKYSFKKIADWIEKNVKFV